MHKKEFNRTSRQSTNCYFHVQAALACNYRTLVELYVAVCGVFFLCSSSIFVHFNFTQKTLHGKRVRVCIQICLIDTMYIHVEWLSFLRWLPLRNISNTRK